LKKLNIIKYNLYQNLKIEDKKAFSIFKKNLYLLNSIKLKLKLRKKKLYIGKKKLLKTKNIANFNILKNKLLYSYSSNEINKKKKFNFFKSSYFNFILVYYFYNYYILKSYHYYFSNII